MKLACIMLASFISWYIGWKMRGEYEQDKANGVFDDPNH